MDLGVVCEGVRETRVGRSGRWEEKKGSGREGKGALVRGKWLVKIFKSRVVRT